MLASMAAAAVSLRVTIPARSAPSGDPFRFGTAVRPDGSALTADQASLRLNGQPWTPVMGEFHYARYPADEWAAELAKMRAGGIDIVATYVFWIHHEEVEGQWDWSGDRDLRRFVRLAGEAGLKVIVRCGPWCHGEVRNGGVPDWAIAKGWKVRTDDPPYLDHVRVIYNQIAAQLQSQLWKDGGPVIGIQLENEFGGPAEHLLHLKRIALEAGLDVPLYTRTGWPKLTTPMPFGEILPLYGAYAEGFWDRETTSMPGNYWSVFHFSTLRTDANIANEALGRREVKDTPDVARYPYLTCEIGGGMMSSYHRRIRIDPRDVTATTLVKLGSGSVSPGYYMYHGGTNPDGKLGTMMENQSTPITNWNDLPVKNYDFQAPLGQYGQVRPHYASLRRLHLFLHDFGGPLTRMPTVLPEERPAGKDDLTTLRWAVRTDGRAGFVFVNNYERARVLPAKSGVQFAIKSSSAGELIFPGDPVTIESGVSFIWPFNLELGHGLILAWATAQPLCRTETPEGATFYFAAIPGITAQLAFAGSDGSTSVITVRRPSRDAVALPATFKGMNVRTVVLSEADSLALSKDPMTGGVSFDPVQAVAAPVSLTISLVRSAGPLRKISMGAISRPVAAAPTDADFGQAAEWQIKLPANFDPGATDALLRIHYVGDVARVLIGGKLVTDDFFNGAPVEIGLRRYAAELRRGEVTVLIVPLQSAAISGDHPLIYLPATAHPSFGGAASVVALKRAELVANPTAGARGLE